MKRAEAPSGTDGEISRLPTTDIEGAEASLFSADTGPASLFTVVIMEPHDWMLPGQKSSVPFFRWHAAHGCELVFGGENILSTDWDKLTA